MEFHISRAVRDKVKLDDLLFSFAGNVVFANVAAARKLAQRLNELSGAETSPEKAINAGALFAMGLIDELSHALVARYRKEKDPAVMSDAVRWVSSRVPAGEIEKLLLTFVRQFPTVDVYKEKLSPAKWLSGTTEGVPNREIAFEEMLLLWIANSNPAFVPFRTLFDDNALKEQTGYKSVTASLPQFFATRPPVAPKLGSLLEALQAPMLASPDSLTGQLDFISEEWAEYVGQDLRKVLLAIDVLREEEVAVWMRFHPAGPDRHRHGAPGHGGEGFVGDEFVGYESEFIIGPDGQRVRRYAEDYQAPLNEYEAFSADQAWMPTVVLIAKSTYVWLEQLSKKYQRHIQRLDEIPDEELNTLVDRGITGLWLIGLWERSRASKTIKRLRGNPDAVASAYSLKDYLIAEDLGGEPAYENLRHRAAQAGLRLASDMVPNHMGIDSDWVIEHPDWFLSRGESPFPVYCFDGPDLSTDSRVEIKLEDHYYDQTDAAVVFRLRHYRENRTRYMYHGNDGTTFAWNDTAQLDYSKADVREHVIQVILDVARRFPIIRFDAAMVLAKRHVQRLWFPLPGAGGSIPSRAEDAISDDAFNALMPHEFWREVVDRVAVEVPGTLLLAEAFWLLEGYFVRTLGMHRVYNSAFMNMLRDEENAKYRSYLKKTVEFDPDILKRYVNFMSNPDEKTAFEQFGSGDKFFGVSVLLATLPGLPMFGHGQVEGFTERYGMDFKQARMDEYPNDELIARHRYLIAPLLKNRQLFAESTHFVMYDFWNEFGGVDENVFAYSNMHGDQRGIIFYNNRYGQTRGTIKMSVAFLEKHTGATRQKSLGEGLRLDHDHDAIFAYRDTVQGLEYLRRARDFRDHGLTVELRGYQHLVLLGWRQLRSSEEQPWDRLCDMLNGSGVYSVDEALSQLRLQPLVDALRGVVNQHNIHLFSSTAAGFQASKLKAAEAAKPAKAKNANPLAKLKKTAKPAAVSGTAPEPTLDAPDFLANVSALLESLSRLSPALSAQLDEPLSNPVLGNPDLAAKAPPQPGNEKPAIAEESPSMLAAASIQLPFLVATFPEALRAAAQSVLPTGGADAAVAQTWAPVLAWIALRSISSPTAALAVYDELMLRNALAETFSSVGVAGEQAWRAAAQVRVLLHLATKPSLSVALASEAFWKDADVRWLTGSHASDTGVDYFEQEKFESFVSWLQLPALLAKAKDALPRDGGDDAGTTAAKLAAAAKAASYKVETFLDSFNAKETQTVSAPVSAPVAKPRKAVLKKKPAAKVAKPKPKPKR